LLALRTPVAIAAPLAVLVSIAVAGVIVLQDWQRIELRSAGGFVVPSLLGIPLGVMLLAKVDDHAVNGRTMFRVRRPVKIAGRRTES
jgi:uncharacterized protein